MALLCCSYLRTWFLLDLVSSLPLDQIVGAAGPSNSSGLVGASRALRILRMVKLLSLLRLLRLSRLVRYVNQYEEVSGVLRSFGDRCNVSTWPSGAERARSGEKRGNLHVFFFLLLIGLSGLASLIGSLSKPGRRRQREGPGKDCFRISDVFATLLILILAQISSISAKVL